MSQSSEQFIQQREEEESNVSFLRETTAMQRRAYVLDIVEQIENGTIDPLAIHIQLKCTENLIKLMTDKKDNPLAEKYAALLLDAAEKHGKKFELHNATFQIKEAGTVYDYSKCQDSEVLELQALEKSVKADLKIREDFLKALPISGIEILHKETGELVTVYPPSKRSTTIVQTTLK